MAARLAMALGAAGFALAACSTDGVPTGGVTSSDYCIALYKRLDFAVQTMSTPSGRSDRMAIPVSLQPHVAALQQNKCLSRPGDLQFPPDAPAVAESGAAISPVTIHVGTVTDMSADADAIAFFESRGIKTLSIGQPGLGRRIYIGAFTTAGGRDSALALARQAGFEWPYVITYGPLMRP